MDFYSAIAAYLANNGIGVITTPATIFIAKQPDSPDNCVAILPSLSPYQPNVTIPELQFPRFQVIVRNTDYETASTQMRAIRSLLHDKIALNLTDWHCLYVRAEQEGGPIGDDDVGRPEFSINFGSECRFADGNVED